MQSLFTIKSLLTVGSTKIVSSFKRENIRAQSQSKAKINLQPSNGGHLMVLAYPKHCMTPSVLGPQLQLRLHLHQWPSMASHSAEPQLLCVTPSCLQNQYHLGDSYTLPSPATAQGTTLAISGTQPLCSQKTLPRRCHLNDAGLFLITANFLAPANQHQ